MTKNITRSMLKAVLIAARDGGAVVAGKSEHRGWVEEVTALTIGALVARGLMSRHIGPDGGVMGRLTESGTRTALESGEAVRA